MFQVKHAGAHRRVHTYCLFCLCNIITELCEHLFNHHTFCCSHRKLARQYNALHFTNLYQQCAFFFKIIGITDYHWSELKQGCRKYAWRYILCRVLSVYNVGMICLHVLELKIGIEMRTTPNNLAEADDISIHTSDEESDDESVIEDGDTCTPFELEHYFQQKFYVHDETAVTLKKNYILSLTKDDTFTRLATGLSDGTVYLFDIRSERGLSYSSPDCIAPPPTDPRNRLSVCGVRFMDETPNLLLVGTTNHLIRLFDLRTQDEVGRFDNITKNEAGSATAPKEILCFDRNSNSRILCVGTEQHCNNVFLLFYDLRERKEMGGYFNCHQDDVSTLRFHPQNPDLLCSGSTDGLINIFDLQKTTEDDALLVTFNTESSVYKVNWHKNIYDKDVISSITHTNDFKLYECEEDGCLIAEFERTKITESIKRKTPANCNLIDCHNMRGGEILLLTGSNLNKGEIMRSLMVQNKKLLPAVDFQGNKQIVRESVLDSRSNVLITAGECGIVTLWTHRTTPNPGYNNLKSGKKKSNKATPY